MKLLMCLIDRDNIHEVTPPYSPESNIVTKRKNKTLVDMISAMFVSSGLPNNLFVETLMTTCYIN